MTHILREGHSPVRLIANDRPNRRNFAADDKLVEVWRASASDRLARAAIITGSAARAFDACNHQLMLRPAPGFAEGAVVFREKRPP